MITYGSIQDKYGEFRRVRHNKLRGIFLNHRITKKNTNERELVLKKGRGAIFFYIVCKHALSLHTWVCLYFGRPIFSQKEKNNP